MSDLLRRIRFGATVTVPGATRGVRGGKPESLLRSVRYALGELERHYAKEHRDKWGEAA